MTLCKNRKKKDYFLQCSKPENIKQQKHYHPSENENGQNAKGLPTNKTQPSVVKRPPSELGGWIDASIETNTHEEYCKLLS